MELNWRDGTTTKIIDGEIVTVCKILYMWRYRFYYQIQVDDGVQITYAVKHCKRPRATSPYKNLELMFNKGLIAVYGYDIESNI